MKNTLLLLILFTSSFCSIKSLHTPSTEKIEILKIDSTKEFYVFKTNSKTIENSIVIAEKSMLGECVYNRQFIIVDSIKQSSKIKSGSNYDLIGFNAFTIDGIKVKNSGVLIKYINNCQSLSN